MSIANNKFTNKQLKKAIKVNEDLFGNFLRKLSIRVTKYVAQTNMTPNQITLASFMVFLIGVVLIFPDIDWCSAVGGLLIFFSAILDRVDGEIARLKNLYSKQGAWLDGILDRVKENILFLCLTSVLYRQTGDVRVWTLGFLALISKNMSEFVNVYNVVNFTSKFQLRKTNNMKKLVGLFKIDPHNLVLGESSVYLLIVVGIMSGQLLPVFWFFVVFQNLFWVGMAIYTYFQSGKV